jgi:hypothetical protein
MCMFYHASHGPIIKFINSIIKLTYVLDEKVISFMYNTNKILFPIFNIRKMLLFRFIQ